MPEQSLHVIVEETQHAIAGLEEVIRRQEEVAKSHKRLAHRRWLIVLAAIPVAMLLSGGTAVGVITTCFVTPSPTGASACQIIPGYQEAVAENESIISEFRRLQEITARNGRRLDELENRMN